MDGNKQEYAKTEWNQGGLTGPIFLIFIGIIFLLNTTGLISWQIWQYLFRFWPLFLILLGVQILFGYSRIGKLIIGAIGSIFLVLTLIISIAIYNPELLAKYHIVLPGWIINLKSAGEWGTDTQKEVRVKLSDYSNVKNMNLNVKVGSGKFSITDSNITDYVRFNSHYDKSQGTNDIQSSLIGTSLNIDFNSKDTQNGFFSNNNSYDFLLGARGIVTNIDIDLGTGDGDVNIDGTSIDKLNAKVGVGDLKIRLGKNAIPSGQINLELGTGDIELNLPHDVGYSLSYKVGIGDITADGNDFSELGNSNSNYKSNNYNSAVEKVDIVAEVGVGDLKIKNN